MKNRLLSLIALVCCMACSGPKDGEHTLHIFTTNDVHGAWFSKSYVNDDTYNSLFSVKKAVDGYRSAYGEENVLLIDVGDGLQGDDAAYYFNYVDTKTHHVFPRILSAIGYDVAVVGNHDIETGHDVYDRVAADMKRVGIPWLAGNAIRNSDGKPYFGKLAVFKRAGLKVAVLGYTNANIAEWLNENLWSGITFESLLPLVQNDVDEVRSSVHPDVMIVASHSGTGDGDGTQLENQSMDLFNSLEGVDVLIGAHDHCPLALQKEGMCLVNSGSRAKTLTHSEVSVSVKGHKVVSKTIKAELVELDKNAVDSDSEGMFAEDFNAVKQFTNREVGILDKDVYTRDALKGMCDYMNFIHDVCLASSGAQISIAAPLSYDKVIKEGMMVYKDMSVIYPFENQLIVITMTGDEIRRYLECSYDRWIRTVTPSSNHIFNMVYDTDPRNGRDHWFFKTPTYNFDSAAGLVYAVDVTKEYGSRVTVSALADGTQFNESSTYTVAMTSYRASGGGGLLAGIGIESVSGRVVDKMPAIRDLAYEYIKDAGGWNTWAVSASKRLGAWTFAPADLVAPMLASDFALLFEE